MFGTVPVQYDGLGVVAAEDPPPTDVVDDQQVATLTGEFGTRVGQDIAIGVTSLGREADHDGVSGARSTLHQLGEDVGVLDQSEVLHRPVG